MSSISRTICLSALILLTANLLPSTASPQGPIQSFPPAKVLQDEYVGGDDLERDLESGLAAATAMSSGDFDEDGMPDLIRGYAGFDGGFVTMRRGDVRALFPSRTGEPPFHASTRVFNLPEPPDFLCTGDFDADGHWDIISAARGGRSLYLRKGDGRGGLKPALRIDVAGSVTAMAAGEINRADGLIDLVVGVVAGDGPAVLVYEGPDGALAAEPERVHLMGVPEAFALGRLDSHVSIDLAIAAGDELVIVHGRNRQDVADDPNHVDRYEMPSRIHDIVVGDFVRQQSYLQEVAILHGDGVLLVLASEDLTTLRTGRVDSETTSHGAMLAVSRVFGRPTEDLIVVDAGASRIHAFESDLGRSAKADLTGQPVAILPMRLNRDALSDLVLFMRDGSTEVLESYAAATFMVTNTNSGGSGSLGRAIEDANDNPGPDAIEFDIAGAGPRTIVLTQPLPAITESVTIDGYTQSGAKANTVPAPGLSDALLHVAVEGLGTLLEPGLVLNGAGSTVRGLAIYGFEDDGITVNSSGNIIEGNYVGTQTTGVVAIGNLNGIRVWDSDNTVGGTVPAARNLVSGNFDDGVDLRESLADVNRVQGNYIGTDASGEFAVPNGSDGVQILAGAGNLVGGTSPGAGNLISGNDGSGVFMDIGDATGNLIQGNTIGLNPSGEAALPNGSGILIEDAPDNTVGGTVSGAGNLVSGNTGTGVTLAFAGATGNEILGNLIGTDAVGGADLGNGKSGVEIRDAPTNTVGGTSEGAGNVISGNDEAGILLTQTGATGNQILGNLIGTDVTGTADLGNTLDGVRVISSENKIGGTTAAHRNIISGNDQRGVAVVLNGTTGNRIRGNYIGTDVHGTALLGNSLEGILISGASDNSVGGTGSGLGNLISGNAGDGIFVDGSSADGNEILGNSIHSNGQLGIDLGSFDGTTPNDGLDADSGANQGQNHPVLTGSLINEQTILISGSLHSAADSEFRIEFFTSRFCDPSGHGEGRNFIGFHDATTADDGNIGFAKILPVATLGPNGITATATDENGNTSEFSNCHIAGCQFSWVFAQTILAPDTKSLSWATPEDIHFAKGDLAQVGSYTTTDSGQLLGSSSLDTSADEPAAGNGLYYLVRTVGCGSWQTATGAEPDRDTALP